MEEASNDQLESATCGHAGLGVLDVIVFDPCITKNSKFIHPDKVQAAEINQIVLVLELLFFQNLDFSIFALNLTIFPINKLNVF